MADISIESAVGAGFQLIARRPLAVLAWGAVRMGALVLTIALLAPAWLSFIGEAAQYAHAKAGATLPADESARMMSRMMFAQGMNGLLQILNLGVAAVVACAVIRAIVHPARSAYAYLRLGAPEFFAAVLLLAAGFVIVIGVLVVVAPVIIACVVLATLHAVAAAIAVAMIAVVVLFAALVYGALRFALLLPMLVDDGQFHLFDAWTLTRGHVANLFAIALCMFGVGIGVEILVIAVGLAIVIATVGLAPAHIDIQALLRHSPADLLVRAAPALLAIALIGAPILGCLQAIFISPWARAYRDLRPGTAAPDAPAPAPAAPPAAPAPATA